jgi:hypothetical protein
MRREWEEAHKVTEETATGPPSRRANATFTACPSGNYIWAVGGEFFSEDKKAVSLNSTYLTSRTHVNWAVFLQRCLSLQP